LCRTSTAKDEVLAPVINEEAAASGDPTPPSAPADALQNRRIESRLIADLKRHPNQDGLFFPLEGEEFERFIESLKGGLDDPIEITPDNVIVDGHQRVRAALELGWTHIQVWVRDDLVDQAAVDRRHIEANFNRRQLTGLDRARLAQ
jgi:ParB-like chromosome segregation protein Spo0J